MDDFLHNLRSGKLKQSDRSNRPYSDPQYKSGQRRNVMDRRKKELDAFERLNAVKEALEAISTTQKRMAEAYEARTQAEERKARAMEVLAKNLYRMLNPEAKNVDELFAPETQPLNATVEEADSPESIEADSPESIEADSPESIEADSPESIEDGATEGNDNNNPQETQSQKLTEEQRQRLFVIIDRMRMAGDNWEKIARNIASQGYSTVSGKGNWRGIMAKTLYEKMLNE